MASGAIIVEGLREFSRELRQFDDKKLLAAAHKSVSSYVGQETDKNRRRLMGRFPSLSKLEIKPSAATSKVQLTLRAPFGHASEWGTRTHVVFGRRVPVSRMRRPVWPAWSTDGHLAHPVIRDKADEIGERYLLAIEEATRAIFPD